MGLGRLRGSRLHAVGLTCASTAAGATRGYCNPAYDKLYQQQGVTIDQKQRQKIVWQMQKMIADQRPYIMLVHLDVVQASAKKWAGFVAVPGRLLEGALDGSPT